MAHWELRARTPKLDFIMERRSTVSSIPLSARLPNPPPLPEGLLERDGERRALVDALEDTHVVLVYGPEGLGKRTLILDALHGRRPARVARTVYVELQDGERIEQLLVRIIQPLAKMVGVERIEWATLFSDVDNAIALALDLAEEAGVDVFADNLVSLRGEAFGRFVRLLSRYARTSRWILATPSLPSWRGDEPGAAEEGQVVEVAVGPLSSEALGRLGRAWNEDIDQTTLDEAIEASRGRPGVLKQLLSETVYADRFRRLDRRLAAAMDVLAVCARPLPGSVVQRVGEMAAGAIFADERFDGLVRRTEQGWAARANARVRWLESRPAESVALARQKAVQLLADSVEPALVVERLRLLLETGATDAALALLERRGRSLWLGGWAPEVWRVLQAFEFARLWPWRLRTAAHLGKAGEVRAWLDQGPPEELCDDPFCMFVEGTARFAFRQLDAGLQVAERLTERVERLERGDARQRRELVLNASVLHANLLLAVGRANEALERAERFEPTTTRERLLSEAHRCAIHAAQGDARAVLASVQRLRPDYLTLEPFEATWVSGQMIWALYVARKIAVAHEVVDELDRVDMGRSFVFIHGRASALIRVVILLEAGELERARDLQDRLGPLVANDVPMQCYVRCSEYYRRVSAGEFAGLEADLAHWWDVSRSQKLNDVAWGILRFQVLVDTLNGRTTALPDFDDIGASHDPGEEAECRLAIARQQVVHAGLDAAPVVNAEVGPRLKIPQTMLLAVYRALNGDLEAAHLEVSSAMSQARDEGLRVQLAEALCIACDMSVLADRGRLREYADQLTDLAEAVGSARYRAQARFYDGLGRALAGEFDGCEWCRWWSTLAELATLDDVAPAAARRARHLLGLDAALDRLDRALVRAVCDNGLARPACLMGEEDGRIWGIDRAQKRVWFADRPSVAVSAPTQWGVLECLADRGGRADKETLLEHAWGIEDYHPLRHDNRLRLAVHKLRKKLERDSQDPALVATDEDVYFLVGRFVDVSGG